MPAKSMLTVKDSTTAIEPANSQPSINNLDSAFPSTQFVLWGAIVGLVIVSSIGGLIYTRISKRKQHSVKSKLSATILCSGCRYFNDNQFVKCALHPSCVLTEQAVDCLDYCQTPKLNQVEKLRKVLLTIKKGFFN